MPVKSRFAGVVSRYSRTQVRPPGIQFGLKVLAGDRLAAFSRRKALFQLRIQLFSAHDNKIIHVVEKIERRLQHLRRGLPPPFAEAKFQAMLNLRSKRHIHARSIRLLHPRRLQSPL